MVVLLPASKCLVYNKYDQPQNDYLLQRAMTPRLSLAPDSGWDEVKTQTGEVFYINHKDKTTSWDRPAVISAQAAAPPPPVVAGALRWLVVVASAALCRQVHARTNRNN